MPFLTIAAIEVELVSFRRRSDEMRGEAVRAFNGRLMDGTDAPKRSFEGQADWMSAADVDALRAAIAAGPVVCAGDALRGESITCRVTVQDSPYGPDVQGGVEDWDGFNEAPTLLLVEV